MGITGEYRMETTYYNRGGWFGNLQNSTGESLHLNCIPKCILAVSLVSLLVNAGTSAVADDLIRLQQNRENDAIISNPLNIYTVDTKSARTSTEDIEQIRNVLSPAISDLAKSFNVSRQTIYNWMKGEQPTPEHTARLRDFALVADIFAEAGVPVNSVLLKRKVIKDKNLFEIIHEGGSAQYAAQLLLQIVRSETSQRERLALLLAGRKVTQPTADSDLMAANDEV
jgi:DNA-binding transcriptional regulator YiaG